MKKLLLLLLFIPIVSFGQDNGIELKLFSNDLEKIKNAIVVFPKCETTKCGNGLEVYIDSDTKKYYNGKKKGANKISKKNYTKLSEQQFKITGYVIGVHTGYPNLGNRFTLELSNSQLGTIYIKTYNKSLTSELKIVSDIELPSAEVIYCSEFTQVIDKFEDTKTTYTSIGSGSNLNFTKVEGKGKSTIYLSFSTCGSTLNVKEKGAIFLFENGEKLNFGDAEIDVDPGKDSCDWKYKVFIRLNDDQIEVFRKSPVTDSKLYIYTAEYNTKYTERWRQHLICLINDTYKIKD